MDNLKILDRLKDCDKWTLFKYKDKDIFVHDNHRWVLPLIFYYQENRSIPRPCNIVLFDFHHDCDEPQLQEDIDINSVNDIIDLCNNKLHANNNDWLIAGQKLGLIDNAVIFGVQEDKRCSNNDVHILGLPCTEMGFQRNLYEKKNNKIWDILGWEQNNGKYSINKRVSKFVFSIDLDCFKCNCVGHKIKWPDEVFAKELKEKCGYNNLANWSGGKFIRELIKCSGFTEIAREPRYCGGEDNSREIFEKIEKHLFESKLNKIKPD